MRFLFAVMACVVLASPALAQQWGDGYPSSHHARAAKAGPDYPPRWVGQEGPTEHWSQYNGRSYSDGDLWTPNSANGS